jgi:GNAT superfamily N-acetyltransferase
MIIIKEVKTKKDLKKFVEFPIKLYRGCEYYVPAIAMDEMEKFNPKKNPAYEFCETRLFLAYKDNKIVGRICGLINHAYIKKIFKNIIRFTRYDVIDDLEVSKALINAVKEWALSREIYSMMGPIGFTDIDIQGMLVEGFEEMNLSLTIYNYEYYPKHLEQLGFIKDADWVEYQISVPENINPRIERVSELVKKRYGFHRVKVAKNKDLVPYAREAFKVINKAFAKLYGTVPLTEKIIESAISQYIPLVSLDFVIIICNKDEEIIGFGLLVPSLAAAVRKSKGHLFPFGLFRLLKALKTFDILEMYFIAVKPEYQNLGVNAIVMAEAISEAAKHKVKFAETGPELETNNNVQDQWKNFNARQHRRRRCYVKHFEE